MLNADQRRRYARNILLPEIGVEGQQRLLGSRVLIVGCGALGSVVAMYLAASGIGHITIIDFDTIDISNLQRQLHYDTASCGLKKTETLAEKMLRLNPDIAVTPINAMLTRSNVAEIISTHDIVVEGSDNPATKHLVATECRRHNKPYVMGGVREWEGQVTSCLPGKRDWLDLFPSPGEDTSIAPCALGGVLGPLPGIVGSLQASEAIKILTHTGSPLSSRLLLINALTSSVHTIAI